MNKGQKSASLSNNIIWNISLQLLIIIISCLTWSIETANDRSRMKTQFEASCDDRCQCNKSTIICTQTHYKSTDIFLFMRPEVYEVLDTVVVTGNNFPQIEPISLFGAGVIHERLTLLNLSGNHLQTVHGEAFDGLPRLEIFDLSRNNLHSVNGDILGKFPLLRHLHLNAALSSTLNGSEISNLLHKLFYNSANLFSHLESIDLDSNFISSLNRRTFCHLPALSKLSLRDNKIGKLNFDINCFNGLHYLDLAQNELQVVAEEDVQFWDENMPVLENFDLSENPFICNCKLKTFVEFVQKEAGIFANKYDTTCESPEEFQDDSIFEISAKKLLPCRKLGYGAIKTGQSAVYVAMALALIGLLLLLAAILYRSGVGILSRGLSSKAQSKYRIVSGYSKLGGDDEGVVTAEFV